MRDAVDVDGLGVGAGEPPAAAELATACVVESTASRSSHALSDIRGAGVLPGAAAAAPVGWLSELPPAGDDESDDESGSDDDDGMLMFELVGGGNGDVVSGDCKVVVSGECKVKVRRRAAVGDSCVYTHVGRRQAVRAYQRHSDVDRTYTATRG